MDIAKQPTRAPRPDDLERLRPLYVVWETTLACNLKCRHCGSRAGAPRRNELTTAECLSVIEQLHDLGTREITLIGGEAYLRRDWLTLVEEIAQRGILCGLQTGARALTAEKIRQAADAGLTSAGVSIDGLPAVHNHLRGVLDSFDSAIGALRNFRANGLTGTVNTQINSLNKMHLRELMHRIIEAGCTGWQIQLTVAMGRAADRPELLLQPYELLDLMPALADLFVEGRRHGLHLMPGNNIGYFGPYEAFWRSITGEIEYYGGCNAGRTGLGIEADGTIKGCPSLPTSDYAGGNVRDTPLRELWERSTRIGFNRSHADNVARLWGYCRGCFYAELCQGGCTWTSHVLSGRPGNNPFCHHRALKLAERGWRECLVPRQAPSGQPFDFGLFDIIVEDERGERFSQDVFDHDFFADAPKAKRHTGLFRCASCGAFKGAGPTCEHCGTGGNDAVDEPDGTDVYARAIAQFAQLERAERQLRTTLANLQARVPANEA
jgi:radical SAM protein with 4Fe4S-binding SPASM domain